MSDWQYSTMTSCYSCYSTIVTSPAWGMPAAPILAAVAVMEMAMICKGMFWRN